MKIKTAITTLLCVFSASLGISGEPKISANGEQFPTRAKLLTDVELGPGGELLGQLLNQQNAPLPHVRVEVLSQGKPMAESTSDLEGRFKLQGMRGGVYTLKSAQGEATYRFWKSGTAPPTAGNEAVLYHKEVILRGQHFKLRHKLFNPVMAGTAAGGALALPILLHNDEPITGS